MRREARRRPAQFARPGIARASDTHLELRRGEQLAHGVRYRREPRRRVAHLHDADVDAALARGLPEGRRHHGRAPLRGDRRRDGAERQRGEGERHARDDCHRHGESDANGRARERSTPGRLLV